MSPALVSERKIEANRQNAALSTGPTSAEGKVTSSANAISHGLTSRHPVLSNEDPADYEVFVQNYRDEYRPNNPLARARVTELADLRWRLRRVPVLETQLLNREMRAISQEEENANLHSNEILAIAFERLIERKVIQNLFAQEGRLYGRAVKIEKLLALIERAVQRRLPESMIPILRPKQQQPTAPVVTQPELPVASNPILKNEPIHIERAPGRNESCPCGSGIKFKRCCLGHKILTAAA